MAQEEKRVIIHFDTLEGFQARLTDGTLTEKGDYIVLIKDSALIWVKGQFFTGPSVLSIPKYIKDCEIIQESGKPLTLKFVGAEWNTEEKIYKEFNKTIELTLASTQSDGLMSKEDKAKVDKILTTGAGTKFLGDDGKYYPIELTTEAVETTDEIPVAGGPLAELLNSAGITSISSRTNLQALLTSLFTKELWPTNLVFKEGTIKSTVPAPTMTINKSGLVEVGTDIIVSETTINAGGQSTTARTYSGFTYGYSASNDNTKDSDSTSISVSATNTQNTTDKYQLSRTINNDVENATGSADISAVKLASKTFKAIEGVNTVKAEVTGIRHSCTFAAMPVYYACSNLGKTSEDHKSSAKDSTDLTSVAPTNSVSRTVTGVYPYYTNKDTITAFSKLPLTTNKTLDVEFVAETASNKHSFKLPAKFNVTSITLLNTLSGNYEVYDISKFTITTEDIDVQGSNVSYKVYTRNDGTNGASSFKIIFA